MKSAEAAVKYLKKKIEASTKRLSVEVDDSLHSGLEGNKREMRESNNYFSFNEGIVTEQTSSIRERYPDGSFHHLFWDQQVKALATTPKQRRWHPMLIRWCLHLKMLSTSAYESLRGILQLPCGRTLQDYTRWVKADCGVQPEVVEQLQDEAKIDSLEEWQKYVAVLFDEMKIKEGIVYSKSDCRIVGYVNFGSTNNDLLINEISMDDLPVAKHMLMFVVRGVFIRMKFPYAQFATADLSADLLYPIVWEVIRSLECAGFKVISVTGDKASTNRTFFRMNQSKTGRKTVHKIENPYSKDQRFVYFLSDVPHLIKTTRNCWSNSFGHSFKRALWVNDALTISNIDVCI